MPTHNRRNEKNIGIGNNFESEEGFNGAWLHSGDGEHDGSDFLGGGRSSSSGIMSSGIGSLGSSLSTRPMSASGGDAFGNNEARRHHLYGDLPLNLGTGISRSQSAAPSSSDRSHLGPPPGLVEFTDDSFSSSSSSRQFNNQWGNGIRRPASAGGLSSASVISSSSIGATLRPAAKTLMDLIQEDSTPDDGRIQNTINTNSFVHNGVNTKSHVSSSTSSYGVDNINHRVSSPATHQSRQNTTVASQLSSSPGMNSYLNSASSPNQPQYQIHQQQHFVQERNNDIHNGYHNANGQIQTGAGHREVKISIDQQHMQQNTFNPRQIGNLAHSRSEIPPEDIVQNSMYSQLHPSSIQHGIQSQIQSNLPQQQPTHIYYNGQRIELGGHGIQAEGLQNHRLQTSHSAHQQGMQGLHMQGLAPTQTIQLPNGQTVYLNTSPPPPPAYGYTTMQYHNPHSQHPHSQHPHLMQQSVHQGVGHDGGGQYISVVPVQGGPPMTYWQPNGASSQPASLNLASVGGLSVQGIHGPNDISSLIQQGQAHAYVNNNTINPKGREKAGRGKKSTNTGRRGGDNKTPAVPLSSPILEEFRASKSRDWTIRKIEGNVVEFCQDQNGSRFIQQRLEMGDVSEQTIVMQEVLPQIRSLRENVFGNYVVQKLLDFGTPKMKAEIQSTLEGEMVQLSLQMYGCRVVQKALEALSEDDLPRLLREFHHNVLSCIHDQNGNHVIQKCIEVLNSRAKKARLAGDVQRASFLAEQIDFIVDDILFNTTTLSCHPYGCRVLQRILEHCDDDKRNPILDEIKTCHERLLDDQYGNYVIQHVLQFGRNEDRDSILEIVAKNGLLILSRQKFASNVVEKLLKYGNSQQRCAVVRQMLKVRLFILIKPDIRFCLSNFLFFCIPSECGRPLSSI